MVKWAFEMGYTGADPFADDEIAAVTTAFSNKLFVVSATDGKLRWQRSFEIPAGLYTSGMPYANILAFEDMLIVPAYNLFALDRATGAVRWTFAREGDLPGYRNAAIGGGMAFASGRRLYALDARSGALRWEFDVGEEPFRPVYSHGILYLTTKGVQGGSLRAGHAFALEAATGQVIWSFPLPDATDAPWLGGSGGLAGLTAELVVVPSRNGRVYALDRATGALRWEHRGRGPYDAGAIVGNVVVVGGDATYLEALDLLTGRLLWEKRLGGYIDKISPGPGVILVNVGRLFAFDETGQLRWAYGGADRDEIAFMGRPLYRSKTIFLGGTWPVEQRPGLFALDVPF